GAARAGGGERAQRGLADHRMRLGDRADIDVDMAAEQRAERRRAALERHALSIGLGKDMKEVLGRDARRSAAEAKGERLRLRGGEKILEGARRVVGIDGERLTVERDERDRREIVSGVARVLVEGLVDRVAVAG